MKIIFKANGESNVEEILIYNPEGVSYHHSGEYAKMIMDGLHEALTEDFVENKHRKNPK
tara:strand:+ start:1449 stop:1625 length:177 start_codon:yes stop_codon:yes gene_type:complete